MYVCICYIVVNECCDKNNVQNTYTLRRLSRAKLFEF